MSTQYDVVGEAYEGIKASPVARYAEQPAVRRMLGDVRGLRVIDLACGTGFYTRLVRRLGAAAVVGVDVSGAMVEFAQAQEAEAPLGVSYRCRDAKQLGRIGDFDVALCAFLFNYATHPDELLSMSRAVRANLTSAGRLVGVTVNPACRLGPATYTPYGFTVTRVDPARGGGQRFVLRAEGAGFEVENWRWSRASYEDALTQAGFREIVWEPVLPTEEGRRVFPEQYWDDYVNDPILIGLRAIV